MKKARVESKKIRRAPKPRHVAGVQVRSGVKAGLRGTSFREERGIG